VGFGEWVYYLHRHYLKGDWKIGGQRAVAAFVALWLYLRCAERLVEELLNVSERQNHLWLDILWVIRLLESNCGAGEARGVGAPPDVVPERIDSADVILGSVA